MLFTVFDCETTGLPKKWSAPMNDLHNWPRVIQLAWALYDGHGNLMDSQCDLIKPDGWVMPTEEFWIENGFTQEQSEKEGIPIKNSLLDFKDKALEKSQFLIAHNMSFDYKVVGSEFLRAGIRSRNKPEKLCTKNGSTKFCAIPHNNGRGGYKWPKLEELHRKLFKEDFDNAHDAMADVKACARCFFKLKSLGVM